MDPTIGRANSFVPFSSHVLLGLWPLDRDLTKSYATCREGMETVYLWGLFSVCMMNVPGKATFHASML